MAGADAAASGGPDVYLHVGLPKTGTSYLQDVLWHSRKRLAGAGVLVPGERPRDQTLAVWDLMGRRTRGADLPQVTGSWQRLVDSVRGWPGSAVVISEEFLTHSRPRDVRRVVSGLAPSQVHVVVTLRDLARVISATWQQNLSKGHSWSWAEFLGAVRDPASGPATAGVAFWLRQDLIRVLDAWETAVPRERMHLVTVPPPGAAPRLLLERFAAAARLDPALLDDAGLQQVNASVGAAEAEVLRRLNLGLGGRLNERQYIRAVQRAVQPALAGRTSTTRIGLPVADRSWIVEQAEAMVEVLRERDYEVAGDWADLIPSTPPTETGGPAAVSDAEVADAAVAALVGVTEQYATYWWRTRRPDPVPATGGGVSALASRIRAKQFAARVRALELADRHRLLGRAASRYLRRTSHRPGAG